MVLEGIFLGTGSGLGVVLAAAVWRGWQPPPMPDRLRTGIRDNWIRLWKAAAVALVVAAITRWPVAIVAAGILAYLWPKLFGGTNEGRDQIARLEAIATWTESLRDTIAAAVGLEQAILASAENAPDSIRPQLQRLGGRLRSHIPLPQALSAFAEDFDDASVDLVAAALVMNSRLRGSGLVGTLTALASTARAELDMRTRVEESRKNLRRSARTIIAITLIFAGGLMLLSRDYLSPYGTVAGQLMLGVVISLFAAGFWWIQSASQIKVAPRFLASPKDLAESSVETS